MSVTREEIENVKDLLASLDPVNKSLGIELVYGNPDMQTDEVLEFILIVFCSQRFQLPLTTFILMAKFPSLAEIVNLMWNGYGRPYEAKFSWGKYYRFHDKEVLEQNVIDLKKYGVNPEPFKQVILASDTSLLDDKYFTYTATKLTHGLLYIYTRKDQKDDTYVFQKVTEKEYLASTSESFGETFQYVAFLTKDLGDNLTTNQYYNKMSNDLEIRVDFDQNCREHPAVHKWVLEIIANKKKSYTALGEYKRIAYKISWDQVPQDCQYNILDEKTLGKDGLHWEHISIEA